MVVRLVNTKLKTKLRGFSSQANYSNHPLSAKLVPTFADRGCRVVSATDPTAVKLGFLDVEQLLFHSSSSSVIFMRLSGPRSGPIISQKI
jgi:hypothetical protein